MTARRPGRGACLVALVLAALVLAAAHPALAQAHNPFGVGISEGGGAGGGLTSWLLAVQGTFERRLSGAMRAVRGDPSAAGVLVTLAFAYGVFHAAGPGHGKAVITSWLFANERALRRGLVLSLLAAVLQGTVAVALVGVLALGLHATAQRMKEAASLVESLSYAGVALLGAWLVWRKGRRLVAALAVRDALPALPLGAAARLAPAGAALLPTVRRSAFDATPACGHGLRYAGAGALAAHEADCRHCHAPDPAALGEGFSWREAALTVVAAGARPCSGAILVLVFAMAQGLFGTGVLAVTAMSLGTAITTGALAALAVLARDVALRLTPATSPRGVLVIRLLEMGAALVVLLAGLSLLLGSSGAGGA